MFWAVALYEAHPRPQGKGARPKRCEAEKVRGRKGAKRKNQNFYKNLKFFEKIRGPPRVPQGPPRGPTVFVVVAVVVVPD